MRRNNSLGVLFAAAWMGLGVFPAAAATQIYRSVGPGTTAALATGNTLTISGGIATFAYALPNTVGVGDAIQYDSNNDAVVDAICFIQSRIDPFQYTVQNNLGGSPVAASGATICAVYRAYNRLSRAESGTENTGIAAAVRNFDTWSGGRDLVANNEVWNIACYGDAAETNAITIAGWTTDNTHYLRIFTPSGPTESGTSQRHAGKWTASAYQIVLANGTCISQTASTNLELEGLQFHLTAGTSANSFGINLSGFNAGDVVRIHHCIFRGPGNSASYALEGICMNSANSGSLYVWNNLAYDFGGPYGQGFNIDGTSAHSYLYNNTAFDCTNGFEYFNGTAVLKNNLAQSCLYGFRGAFDPSSDYNLSDLNDAPGTHARNQTTVLFVDPWNDDWHVANNDTGAKDFGVDLSSDPNLSFGSDLDNETRSGGWDIGADEQVGAGTAVSSPVEIYRSIGPGQSAALATGGATQTLSISGSTATFSQALPNEIGVGDAVVYNATNLAFICGRNSPTSYLLQQKDGTSPLPTVGTQSWSIYRAYIGLDDAETGNENTGIPLAVRDFDSGNQNLIAARQTWHLACYAGVQADTAAVSFDWVTAPSFYVHIFTPVKSTDVGVSQRHPGQWTNSAYHMVIDSSTALGFLGSVNNYYDIEGLQIHIASNPNYTAAIFLESAGDYKLHHNILRGEGWSATQWHEGIAMSSDAYGSSRIWNNLSYDFGGSDGNGFDSDGVDAMHVFYNNTAYHCTIGFEQYNGSPKLKNNLVQNCSSGYLGVFDSASDTNLSDLNDAPGINPRNAAMVSFVNASGGDFHLAAGDTAARGHGLDLSMDPQLSFEDDWEGENRPIGGWDIGADQYASILASATPTPTSSASPTETASLSSTVTLTSSATLSHTPTETATPTSSPSPTSSSTVSSTETATGTSTATPTSSASPTWTASLSSTVTLTSSATLSHTPTETPTPTSSPSPTSSSTASFTETPSWTQTLTLTVSESATPTETASPFYTPTSTVTCTNTPTGTLSRTQTMVLSATQTGTQTLTLTATPSWTVSPTCSISPTASPTSSVSPTQVVPRPLLADLSSYPNPFWPRRETVTIRYVLSANADVEAEIFTYLGERVWRQTYAGGQPGGSGSPVGEENLIRWDGYGLSHGKLSGGGYILRVRAHAADGRTETGTCKIGLLGGD